MLPVNDVPENVKQEQQNEFSYYRFLYKKGESVRFLGHLDMVAVFHRAFLIAGIPLAYSAGFNPHPRISFGPPLPSGVIGEREAFDMVVTDRNFPDPLIVNRWLPKDLQVLSFSRLFSKIAFSELVDQHGTLSIFSGNQYFFRGDSEANFRSALLQ